MTSALSEGSTSAMTSSMPTSSATARAVVSLSPVSRTGRRPSAFSDATASADVDLTVSATTKTAVARPSQPAAIAVCPRASAARRAASSAGGRCIAQSASSAGRPTISAWPSTTPSTPSPSRLAKPSTAASGPAADAAAAMAWAIGCSEACSSAPTRRSASSRSTPSATATSTRLIRPVVTVPVLSRTTVSTAPGGLQHLGALDQQAELGAAAGADHERRRGGEAERAGAGDDEDGDRGGERERRALAGAEPERQRGHRERDDDRDEHARDPVRQPLDRRLAGLGVLDEPGDLGQRGVGADLGRADDQAPAGVDRRARDLGARARPRRARTRR